ncbi:MAG TPA: thioredoxin domain-containing protein [Pyrinomonadaceae bacterium]|nr:thioredoxin domain-containing protein [Pyrinomonadaceae bacterium]
MVSKMMAQLSLPVTEHDHVQGSPLAAVIIVEYGDFECPHCGAAHKIVKQIQQMLGDGLRFAYRHFPLTQIHPHAERAAEASEAAGAQGRFWEMHDLLFENQQTLDDWHLIRFAEQLELDTVRFARELAEGRYRERIREDFMSGVRSGVNGTPTFFINGVRHDGTWDIESLLAGIERASLLP